MAKWPTDKELEEIYRKGSEQHNFNYDVNSWHQMEDLLDRDRRRRWVIWFLSGLLFVGFIGGVYWMNSGLRTSTSGAVIQEEIRSSNKIADQLTLDNSENTGLESSESQISEVKDQVKSVEKNSQDRIKDGSKIVDRSTTQSVETSQNSIVQLNKESIFNGSTTTDQKSFESNSNTSPPSDPINFSNTDEGEQSSNLITTLFDQNVNEKTEVIPTIEKPLVASILIDRLAIEEFNLASPEFSTPDLAELKEEKESFSKFTLFTFVGGESSQTPNGSSSSFDPHIGLGGSYLVSPKFGFTLSANYIEDKYKAKADDYKPPTGFWKASGLPQWTDASCDMLELSYGMVYHLNGFNQRGLVINASLNSNFMLSEHYYYNFEDRSENFSSSWSMANKTLLSSISLSANYNLPFQNRWAVQFGPYAKIPISGIGHGDVMLSSFGMRVFLSLNSL